MTLPSLTASPIREGKRRRWIRVILAVILAVVCVLGWRMFTYQRAVRQLREAGITLETKNGRGLADWWATVRADWQIIFRIGASDGELEIWEMDIAKAVELRNLDAVANALRRVNPKCLSIPECRVLQNVDGLKGLTALTFLYLRTCDALQNVDGLKGLKTLERLSMGGCPALQNIDCLSGPVQNRNGDGTKAEWVKMGARKRGTVASEEAGA